jgi:hypothetical protein
MKVYFYASPKITISERETFAKMISVVKRAGVLVLDNIYARGHLDAEMERAAKNGELLLNQVDALIIEGSKPSFESGHLIALAIASQKPILYLAKKGIAVDKNLSSLMSDKKISTLLSIEEYTERTFENKLLSFISSSEKGEGKQIANIKFTLRINKKIERYLGWKSQKAKMTKADFLRDFVERLIEGDEEYKKSNKG